MLVIFCTDVELLRGQLKHVHVVTESADFAGIEEARGNRSVCVCTPRSPRKKRKWTTERR